MRELFLAASLILLGVDAALACDMPWNSFSSKVNTWMKVQSGKPCEIWFRTSGPIYDVQITKRPAHGTARIGDAKKVIYQSRSGYTGADSFTYVYSGRTSRNVPIRSTVTFMVTVTP